MVLIRVEGVVGGGSRVMSHGCRRDTQAALNWPSLLRVGAAVLPSVEELPPDSRANNQNLDSNLPPRSHLCRIAVF